MSAINNFTASYFSLALRSTFETAAVHEITMADVNGDGRLDILAGYFLYPLEDRGVPVRILLQQANGSFVDQAEQVLGGTVPTTVHTRQIVRADFNGDGREDFFFADHGLDTNPYPGSPNVLLISGANGYTAATGPWSGIADFTHSAAVGDIDGDGDIDIFAGNQGDAAEYPYFLVNDGAGQFTLSRSGLADGLHSGDPGVTTSTLFDADGDGDLDLFLGPWDPRLRPARIYENDGTGTFTQVLSVLDIPSRGNVENVIDSEAVDINGDGFLDLVVTTVINFFEVGAIRFYINDGAGNFTDETLYRLPERVAESWNTRVIFGDIDGDGHADMLVTSGSTAPIYINDGTGVFHQLTGAELGPGAQYDRLDLADMNGDGRMDVVGSRGNFAGEEQWAVYYQRAAGALVSGTAANDSLLGDTAENTLTGESGDDKLFGGLGDDVLNGGEGNDLLVGSGGADRMIGGGGDDSYVVDSQSDVLIEGLGGGYDTVIAGLGFYLYDNVERLVIARDAGGAFGVGNGLDNQIVGNAASNLLIADAGSDTVWGGEGNDLLFGESGDDTLFGEAGIDYLVGGIGNDVLNGGDEADGLYGEDGDDLLVGGTSFHTDILVGGAGNDVLDGRSGQPNPDYDEMDGGAGNDSYYVDTGADLTYEAVGGGTDTVYANITVLNAGLYLYANLENLVLQGTTAFGVGNALDNTMTGSASGNWLLGGAGNDTLNGKAGNDVLFGEGGADVFVFEAGTGADVIGDFQAGTDKISLVGYELSFGQVQSQFLQSGNIGAIQFANGDVLVLHGVTMTQLTVNDFLFG